MKLSNYFINFENIFKTPYLKNIYNAAKAITKNIRDVFKYFVNSNKIAL